MVKKVFSSIYAHKTNIDELLQEIFPMKRKLIKLFLEQNADKYDFDVLKVDTYKNTISLISCNDFNGTPEPVINNIKTWNYEYRYGNGHDFKIIFDNYKKNGFSDMKEKKYIKNPVIYHNKWMFVSDNYNGFDVNLSKQRTKMLRISIPNYWELTNKIGHLDFWIELCNTYNIPLDKYLPDADFDIK